MSSLQANHLDKKSTLRTNAYAARRSLSEKSRRSLAICQTILSLPEYLSANIALWYVHCRSEVRTLSNCPKILSDPAKTIAVPYCTADQDRQRMLGLWKLESIHELKPGMWDILEPPKHRWDDPDRKISAEQLDVVIVPGVAFDRSGGRLGNGKGYYDRLLGSLASNTTTIGVAYDAQVMDSIPMGLRDRHVDMLVTESNVYHCQIQRSC
ncbi:MAG: 5-formyltetrahydrofolate cyclo-ligase [Gammaproteobacteria bacterium]|nr:5-formyltetrahydrofolate cyclo-ligase [Gammaproteobacteria bacterium]